MSDDTTLRINKYIAARLGVARRIADDMVAAGRVQINDRPAEMGSRVNPTDIVTVDGTSVAETAPERIVIILNKPVGYVCSHRAQSRLARTIYELLPDEYRSLNSVGRLDRNSSGLILLTNDGEFSHRMTHPRYHKVKIYEVTLDHLLEPLHQQMISDYGVTLEDGVSQFVVERVEEARGKRQEARGLGEENSQTTPIEDSSSNLSFETLATSPDVSLETRGSKEMVAARGQSHSQIYRITMHEGRNRQIRRTFATLD